MAVIPSRYVRCVNIDWLELFCMEEPSRSYEPDDFRARGFFVEERAYGTKMWLQVFTVCDSWGQPMIEVRRCPRVCREENPKAIYSRFHTYLRLVNAYCYHSNPIGILDEFMKREHYRFIRIFRLDLAMDFLKFDSGDVPQKVASRIARHVYAKVNQLERTVHGEDRWAGSVDSSFRWGKSGSMVATRFYNKSKEIREQGMKKSYILAQWIKAGFITSPLDVATEGQSPDVWRLEFEIKSSAKGWLYVQKFESEDSERYWLRHDLDLYSTPQGLLNAFANLVPHYFHFRIYKEGVRKSRCPDKVLFKFMPWEYEEGYRLTSESDFDRVRVEDVAADSAYVRALRRAIAQCTKDEDVAVLRRLIEAEERETADSLWKSLRDRMAYATLPVF